MNEEGDQQYPHEGGEWYKGSKIASGSHCDTARWIVRACLTPPQQTLESRVGELHRGQAQRELDERAHFEVC